jgi:hypothetical protein
MVFFFIFLCSIHDVQMRLRFPSFVVFYPTRPMYLEFIVFSKSYVALSFCIFPTSVQQAREDGAREGHSSAYGDAVQSP